MKKIALLLCMALATILLSKADSYFTMGDNDVVRINPNWVNQAITVPVKAHFDEREDFFYFSIKYPQLMTPLWIDRGPDMAIQYTYLDGNNSIHNPTLNVGNYFNNVTAYTSGYGYWDYNLDSIYEPYGTIKWEAGDYDAMLYFSFIPLSINLADTCVSFDGRFSAGPDLRSGSQGGESIFYKNIYFHFGYKMGDVNGDEYINIVDLNLLINAVNYNTELENDYQRDAADINGDGLINISDVTLLTAMISNGVTSEDGDEPTLIQIY